MPYTLKFSGFISLHLIVAVFGTAVLESSVHRMIPSHSIADVIWKEVGLSITCAASLGMGLWRVWRNSSAKWTWILPLVWFAFGYLAFAGRGDVFAPPFNLSSGSSLDARDVRSFFAFTVPLIRSASYSAGAYISSRFYPASIAPM